MIAGRMRERLTLFEPERSVSVTGTESTEYKTTHTVWAERLRLSGRLREEVGEHFSSYFGAWRIRDVHRVEEGWRVQEPGSSLLYKVTAVERNRSRGFNTINCERVNE